MSKDYMKAFAGLMESSYERYKGCLIRIDRDTFHWSDKAYPTLEGAKDAIDKAFPLLGNSIKTAE